MADRVSVTILVGGSLTTSEYAELAQIVAREGLSIEWDGERFEPEHRTGGEPLQLYAHEVSWGTLDELEPWCVERKLTFARWSGGYPGEWGAERVVSIAGGEPVSFSADEDDRVVIHRADVERLGSLEEIFAHLDAADAAVPPLVIDGDPVIATPPSGDR